jgi:hypothetical protein
LKSFFLAKRGLAETTISGGLLLRQTLAAGEVEEEDEEPLPALEVPLPTGDAEALPIGDAEALLTGYADEEHTLGLGTVSRSVYLTFLMNLVRLFL